MSQGRSIRLFLVDGTPNGLLTAEIMNWTGHVLTGPRSKLSELVQRPEVGRTGIYFLVGPDPENSLKPLVYIGESDDVGKRLKQHNRPEDQGGKDFWERVCLVTSKDQNLTKAHVKHLESVLINKAKQVGRCQLVNGTASEYSTLPEADLADMAFFVEQLRVVLPVLGFEFLRSMRASEPSAASQSQPSMSPVFVRTIPKYNITAKGCEIDGEFVVFAGSKAQAKWTGKKPGYGVLHAQLQQDGVLGDEQDGLLTFKTDYSFSSPSAAAAIIAGRNSNGRKAWRVEDTGQTYADWQDQQVEAADQVQHLIHEAIEGN